MAAWSLQRPQKERRATRLVEALRQVPGPRQHLQQHGSRRRRSRPSGSNAGSPETWRGLSRSQAAPSSMPPRMTGTRARRARAPAVRLGPDALTLLVSGLGMPNNWRPLASATPGLS